MSYMQIVIYWHLTAVSALKKNKQAGHLQGISECSYLSYHEHTPQEKKKQTNLTLILPSLRPVCHLFLYPLYYPEMASLDYALSQFRSETKILP